MSEAPETELLGLVPEHYTSGIAALLLGVSRDRLRDLATQGRLHPEQAGPGFNWLYSRRDLERFRGRPITALCYLRAVREHAGQLAKYADANARRRAAR